MAPKRSSKTAPATETAPVVETPAPVVEATPEVATPEVADVPTDKFAVVLERLQRFATEVKDTIAVVKALQKEFQKVQKTSAKKTKKVASPAAASKPRTPSGFAKPTKLSDDLCNFLGVPSGSQMARTEVTRVINEYIKKNSLQDTNDKRTIVPDSKLLSILKLGEGEKLTYFNLQTYIKHHFQRD